jgi:transposase
VATLAVTRRFDLSDAQWQRLEPLLPVGKGPGRPSRWTKRQLIDGIRRRVRVGSPWRDVPECYGSWRAVYGLFRRWQRAGVWAAIMTGLQADADAAGLITWEVSVDSTIARAHQHAAGARRSRGGLTTKIHLSCEQGQKSCRCWSPPGSEGTRLSSSPSWRRSVCPASGRDIREDAPPGSAPTRHTGPAPTAPTCADAVSAARSRSRPTDPPSQEQGQPGRPTARVLRDGLPAATRCRVRHQPTQTPPRRRHPIRQTRRSHEAIVQIAAINDWLTCLCDTP